MSKRAAIAKNTETSKRPRIEYQLFNSQTWSQHKKELAQQPPKHDPWFDDDDDDFIIIASQKVENQLHQNIPDSNNLDMTYGRFNGNVGVCSTQVQPSTSKATPVTTARTNNQDIATLKKDIEDMKEHFNGDFDDDLFTDVGKEETVDDDPPFSVTQFRRDEPKQQQQQLVASGSSQQNGFKAPLAPPVVKPNPKPVVKPEPISRPSISPFDQSKITRQKEHAKDLQISFLQKQIASYLEKNKELQKTTTENTEKLQIKEGEVAMIRYELNSLKKINETLRMDKFSEKETIKNEWSTKMNELEKQIRAQKAQLDLKDMEMMKTKRRSMNQSVRDETSIWRETSARLRIFVSDIVLSEPRVVVNVKIFEPVSTELKAVRRQSPSEMALQLYMMNFQTLLSMLQMAREPGTAKGTADKLFENAKYFIVDLKKHTKDLNRIKHADPKLISALEYNFLCENIGKNAIAFCPSHLPAGLSIYGGEKMFANERAHIQRRILAAIAIACANSPEFCHKIATMNLVKTQSLRSPVANGDVIVLSDDEGGRLIPEEVENLEKFLLSRGRSDELCFLNLLNEALTEISYSKELFDYVGIVVASTEILINVIKRCSVDWESRKQLRSALNLLKTIVFCRCDNLYAVHAISKLLCQTSASTERQHLLNYLCTNALNGTSLVDDFTHNIVQFSEDSCVLQVYGAILEVSVSQFRPLNRLESQLLFETVVNVTEFWRSSLTSGAEWTTRFLQNTDQQCQCACYKRMVNAFVVLLHLLFKTWLALGRRVVEDGWIKQAVRSGVLLLYDIFKKNYVYQLLSFGSSNTIKTCLQVLFSWIRRHSTELGLQAMHERALSLIDLNMIIPDLVRINEDSSTEINQKEEQMLIESFAIIL